MKQAGRFFLRPNVFFNQLQWSSSHWFILVAFFLISAVETHVGKYSDLYLHFTHLLQTKYGLVQRAQSKQTCQKVCIAKSQSGVKPPHSKT